MLSFLIGFFTCQLAAVAVVTIIDVKTSIPLLSYQFLPGCMALSACWLYSWWIMFLCSDGILFILTLLKSLSYRDNFNLTIRLLARDSAVYFAIMLTCLVLNIAVYYSPSYSVIIPVEWVACIAVSRMMMNLRGLAFNDPLGSQGIDFSVVIFRNRDRGTDGGTRGAGVKQHDTSHV